MFLQTQANLQAARQKRRENEIIIIAQQFAMEESL
jgi:hypothetical protein